ncbi:NAD-glutamate dehydrogenase domain-containing protein [Legionella sp.]|uniref:NAD-glutamate dehydrogenase domain-containing protein n=1 Tax=Legionella sp. TaxID=459 RepID=UPI00257DE74C|nr:NAD-glutamate dehydrogenase domain-containing protein [Legionella sp.]
MTWKETLQKKIIELYKGKKSSALIKNYANIFPHCYIDDYPIETAINDLPYIEKLSAKNPIEMISITPLDKPIP